MEQRLERWARQPGAVVTQDERHFINVMRAFRERGVGYGWMQQVIEWEWQATGIGAHGPEYFGKQIAELEEALRAAREGQQQSVHETVAPTERPSVAESSVEKDICRHGWRGTVPVDGQRIVTPCPGCGAQSLFIASGGHLTCARVPSDQSDGCPSPCVGDTVEKLKQRAALYEAKRRARHLQN